MEKNNIEIGTKEEAVWEDVKIKTQEHIESLEKELLINREILKLAEDKTKDVQSIPIDP